MFFDPCFHRPKNLRRLLTRISSVPPKIPVLIKISPDLTKAQLDSLIRVADAYPFVKGYIIGNLVKKRPKLHLKKPIKGGLSGLHTKKRSLTLVKHCYRATKGKKVIIGCGGIFTAEDAYEYITAGASLVQLITGLIYKGPGLVKNTNKGLVRLLQQDGFSNITVAVGSKVQ